MRQFKPIVLIAVIAFQISILSSCGEYETKNLPDGTLEIVKYKGHKKDIVIPEVIGKKRVTVIGENAFQEQEWFNVVIPNSITTIGNWSFARNLPDGTLTIIKYSGYTSDIVIPSVLGGKKVTDIGESAFQKMKLTSVVIPEGITTIGKSAFDRNQLINVNIPDSVTSIGQSAFSNNHLTDVKISENVLTVEVSTFARNQLFTVIIPNSVTSIEQSAFSDNQLTNVKISENINKIDSYAFFKNKLTHITIPNADAVISHLAFDSDVVIDQPKKNTIQPKQYIFGDRMPTPEEFKLILREIF